MSKYRPEKITLGTPIELAGEFESMLKEYLKPAAKLTREESQERITFVFYPTKSEYFLVSMLFMAIGRKYGELKIEE